MNVTVFVHSEVCTEVPGYLVKTSFTRYVRCMRLKFDVVRVDASSPNETVGDLCCTCEEALEVVSGKID